MAFYDPIKGAENLPSKWSTTRDLGGHDMPIRLEGEIGDVVVRGTIPKTFEGTFYRVAQDQFTPPVDGAPNPLLGHGVVSAFRIHNGQVDFKIRYVQSDRYKVERNNRKTLWPATIQDPLKQHPCIRAVLASTSNTNVIVWAGKLLALQEMDPPYAMDADTLETTGVDPFGNQIISPTFTAHPKIDQNVDELVTWGIDHFKNQVISYSIDRQGVVKNEHRIQRDIPGLIHDIAITENWLVFCQWPTSFNRTPGEQPTIWDTSREAIFIVSPRRPDHPLEGSGWKPYEHRVYKHHFNSEIVHTAGAWEEGGKIFFEGTWPHDVLFPFWPKSNGQKPAEKTVVDLVRLEIVTNEPTNTFIPDPVTLVDIPNEFPRIDERYYCKKYDHVFMNVYYSEKEKHLVNKHVFEGLNATAMLIKSTGELKIYYPGPNCRCQEPVFIPRSDDAPEGDGHVIFAVDRLDQKVANLVILDTKDFEKPVAVIELPLRLRAQIHGNWVDAKELSGRPLVAPPPLHHMAWKHRP
ncbi:lignostilbene dioxygenase family protein [Diaporthe sp. PMI_573]|nr:lignostilbene dioxygenase family protein [Diaporthaceae sp. PMI_573]KAH8746087.1 lignostilbene dioxygenase family protein [Diaporthaceae sp. PMI_573]